MGDAPTNPTQPSQHKLFVRIEAYSGFHTLWGLLPDEMQAKLIFGTLLKPEGLWGKVREESLRETPFVVQVPSGKAFRLLDRQRKVEPYNDGEIPRAL